MLCLVPRNSLVISKHDPYAVLRPSVSYKDFLCFWQKVPEISLFSQESLSALSQYNKEAFYVMGDGQLTSVFLQTKNYSIPISQGKHLHCLYYNHDHSSHKQLTESKGQKPTGAAEEQLHKHQCLQNKQDYKRIIIARKRGHQPSNLSLFL